MTSRDLRGCARAFFLRRVGAARFWADVPHRNRDHRASGAVRLVHSFLSLQRHGRKKVGSLRSAIGLLAADVEAMGGQGGGPRRGARR